MKICSTEGCKNIPRENNYKCSACVHRTCRAALVARKVLCEHPNCDKYSNGKFIGRHLCIKHTTLVRGQTCRLTNCINSKYDSNSTHICNKCIRNICIDNKCSNQSV